MFQKWIRHCCSSNYIASAWRFLIRFLSFIKSFSWDTLQGWHHILAVATGSLGGILSSMLAVGTAKFLQPLWPALFKKLQPVKQHISILSMQLRRPCLLIAYISAVTWLALQYMETIGLKQLLIQSLSRMAITRWQPHIPAPAVAHGNPWLMLPYIYGHRVAFEGRTEGRSSREQGGERLYSIQPDSFPGEVRHPDVAYFTRRNFFCPDVK